MGRRLAHVARMNGPDEVPMIRRYITVVGIRANALSISGQFSTMQEAREGVSGWLSTPTFSNTMGEIVRVFVNVMDYDPLAAKQRFSVTTEWAPKDFISHMGLCVTLDRWVVLRDGEIHRVPKDEISIAELEEIVEDK